MLTASKVALAHACTAAFVLPQRREVHTGQVEGNERHLDLEASIDTGEIPQTIERRWPGFTWRAEIAFVVDLATDAGREVGQGISRAYGDLGPFEIAGTADLVGRGPNGELVIVDRKSHDPNVPRAAVNAQLHTLGLAACRAYGIDTAQIAIWHELRPLDVSAIDALDLDVFTNELKRVLGDVAKARVKYRLGVLNPKPGSHCRWCDAFHDCPEQKALAVDADIALPMRIEASIPFHDDHEAADAWDLLARIDMLAKRIRSALYARAGERPIPLNDGNVLGTVEKMGNTAINAEIAYDVIKERFGVATANDAVTRKVSQAGIERALEKINSSGLKKDVMKQIGDRGGCKREMKTEIAVHAPAQLKAAP